MTTVSQGSFRFSLDQHRKLAKLSAPVRIFCYLIALLRSYTTKNRVCPSRGKSWVWPRAHTSSCWRILACYMLIPYPADSHRLESATHARHISLHPAQDYHCRVVCAEDLQRSFGATYRVDLLTRTISIIMWWHAVASTACACCGSVVL